MCGRTSVRASFEQVADALGMPSSSYSAGEATYFGKGCYNVAPGRSTPVCYYNEKEGKNCLALMRWGLVPSWTKKSQKPDYFRMFNARSEGIWTSPVFKRLVKSRRCVVPILGFFEWKKETSSKKQPYFVFKQEKEAEKEGTSQSEIKKNGIMLLAGLYDTWINGEGQEEYTYSILTTVPCKQIEWLHNRMPVILQDDVQRSLWMKDIQTEEELRNLCELFNIKRVEHLRWHPVTRKVGNLSYNEEDCCEDAREKIAQEHKGSIKDLFSSSIKHEKGEETGTGTSGAGTNQTFGLKLQSPSKRQKRLNPISSKPKSISTSSSSNQRSIKSFFSTPSKKS